MCHKVTVHTCSWPPKTSVSFYRQAFPLISLHARNGRCDRFQDPLQDGVFHAVPPDTYEYQASLLLFSTSYYLCHQVSSSNTSVNREEVSANMLCPHLGELENLGLSWRVRESSRQTECCRVDGFLFPMSWLIQLLGLCDNQQNRQCQKETHFSTQLPLCYDEHCLWRHHCSKITLLGFTNSMLVLRVKKRDLNPLSFPPFWFLSLEIFMSAAALQ